MREKRPMKVSRHKSYTKKICSNCLKPYREKKVDYYPYGPVYTKCPRCGSASKPVTLTKRMPQDLRNWLTSVMYRMITDEGMTTTYTYNLDHLFAIRIQWEDGFDEDRDPMYRGTYAPDMSIVLRDTDYFVDAWLFLPYYSTSISKPMDFYTAGRWLWECYYTDVSNLKKYAVAEFGEDYLRRNNLWKEDLEC